MTSNRGDPLNSKIKSLARLLPPMRRLMDEVEQARMGARTAPPESERLNELERHLWVPPGHFYSPIPSLEEIERRWDQIFKYPKDIPGIDFNDQGQLDLIEEMQGFYKEQPFPVEKHKDFRYFFENPAYSYGDALFLYSMIRYWRPKRIIEVGSGYSSCVSLDTNDLFFDGSIECSFIEPYPELLFSLIRPEDKERCRIISSPVQDVDLGVFMELEEGDILFIDSTHVSRVGSDVNYEIFEILPRLAPGVVVHFHDIFVPFEYPPDWVRENRGWTEAYLLRAFLQFNDHFEVILFADYLWRFYFNESVEKMPLWKKNSGGNIWLRKTA